MFITNSVFKHHFIKQFITLIALVFVSGLFLTTISCGKRVAPLPPNERVSQRSQLSAFQRGDVIILQWQMPARNAASGSSTFIDRVDIYRLAEDANSPLTITESDFASRSILITSQKISDNDFGLKTISYQDRLQFAGQMVRLRYAVRFVNQQGQKAAFSNFVTFEPTANVANAPTSLSAQLSQTSISLKWESPVLNVNNTTPVNIIGYNLYRSESLNLPAKLLNDTPVTDNYYSDQLFEFEKEYSYFVRTVSLGPNATRVESSESNLINIKTIDTFPPSSPESITLAATPTRISIFFPANPETDVIGYRIYRSEDKDLPLKNWNLMTTDVYELTTYQDEKVRSGGLYFYYIIAIDKYNNVSEPSQIVSERAP